MDLYTVEKDSQEVWLPWIVWYKGHKIASFRAERMAKTYANDLNESFLKVITKY